jgi:hypothetical protein
VIFSVAVQDMAALMSHIATIATSGVAPSTAEALIQLAWQRTYPGAALCTPSSPSHPTQHTPSLPAERSDTGSERSVTTATPEIDAYWGSPHITGDASHVRGQAGPHMQPFLLPSPFPLHGAFSGVPDVQAGHYQPYIRAQMPGANAAASFYAPLSQAHMVLPVAWQVMSQQHGNFNQCHTNAVQTSTALPHPPFAIPGQGQTLDRQVRKGLPRSTLPSSSTATEQQRWEGHHTPLPSHSTAASTFPTTHSKPAPFQPTPGALSQLRSEQATAADGPSSSGLEEVPLYVCRNLPALFLDVTSLDVAEDCSDAPDQYLPSPLLQFLIQQDAEKREVTSPSTAELTSESAKENEVPEGAHIVKVSSRQTAVVSKKPCGRTRCIFDTHSLMESARAGVAAAQQAAAQAAKGMRINEVDAVSFSASNRKSRNAVLKPANR